MSKQRTREEMREYNRAYYHRVTKPRKKAEKDGEALARVLALYMLFVHAGEIAQEIERTGKAYEQILIALKGGAA